MSESEIAAELRSVREMVSELMRDRGLRMSRAEVQERLGLHRNTLAKMVKDGRFPAPMKDGKWLSADVYEWESGK